MKKFQLKLPRQYYLGNLPGRLVFLYGNASTAIGLIYLFANGSTFYMIVVKYFLPALAIWEFYLLWLVMLIGTR